jgi:type IV secretion system protein VirD4
MTTTDAFPPLRQPDDIPEEGILVGWSLEHERPTEPIGFSFGERDKDPRRGYQNPVLFQGDGHLITIAPTGAGKGTGCIIPTLLRHPGPVIVVDPKGENLAVTARRRKEMGQRVIVLDPFGVTAHETDRLDPTDMIDIHSMARIDDLSTVGHLVMNPTQYNPRNKFWIQRGIHLIVTTLLHVLHSEDRKSGPLLRTHDILNGSVEGVQGMVEQIKKSGDEDLKAMIGPFETGAPETFGGYMAFAQDALSILRGDSARRVVRDSTFSLDDLTRGEPLSVYIVLPPQKLESHRALLRLWIGSMMHAITRRQRAPEKSTLFVLDEAAQLGPLDQLRQAMTLLRGYGLQTWSFWQDVSQLLQLYPQDWETMVNNCKVLQTFGPNNMLAAEGMGKLTGFHSPHEILDLDYDELILLVGGDEAVIAQRPSYLDDPAFAGLYDDNPLHETTGEILRPRRRRPQRRYQRRPAQAPASGQAAHPGVDEDLLKRLLEQTEPPEGPS